MTLKLPRNRELLDTDLSGNPFLVKPGYHEGMKFDMIVSE